MKLQLICIYLQAKMLVGFRLFLYTFLFILLSLVKYKVISSHIYSIEQSLIKTDAENV